MRRTMLTVRVQPSLHAALKELAHERRKTLNEMCVEVLELAAAANPVAAKVLLAIQTEEDSEVLLRR